MSEVSKYIVLSDAYPFTLCHARRLTEEEKKRYTKESRDFILVAVGESIDLDDIPGYQLFEIIEKRDCTGTLNGCQNNCYEITEEEWDRLIRVNNENKRAKKEKARQEYIRFYRDCKKRAEQQMDNSGHLPSAAEAKKKEADWIRLQNEGGEGYVPHYFSQEEYDGICQKLSELIGE